MVTANQLIWWIDAQGILHSCAQISTPPAVDAGSPPHFAQGQINPITQSGTITLIHNTPAALPLIPRELFDVLNTRFPNTRWWINDLTKQSTTPTKLPVPAHL